MKNLVFAIILAVFFVGLAVPLKASWLVDAERFHISVHGELTCHDCHDDINEKVFHPDPAVVNNSLIDFFDYAQCKECHEDVFDEIAKGSHAEQKVTKRQRFNECIECHNPHYQLSYSENSQVTDLNQPAEKKCSSCHKYQPKLPEFPDEDQACLQCHVSFPSTDTRGLLKSSEICQHCHNSDRETQGKPSDIYPLIDYSKYKATPHKDISCIVCHPQSMAFGHGDQIVGDCNQCHSPHDEKMTHDAHLDVTCEACHLSHIIPIKKYDNSRIEWRKVPQRGRISNIHLMPKLEKETSCRKCHNKDNPIGAAAMVLPAKSVICMPCHAATFSAGDTTSLITLIIFGFGILCVGSIWITGSQARIAETGIASRLFKAIQLIWVVFFSGRIFSVFKILILDGLFQRRLYKISRSRWLIHTLIFFPFLIRFCWGLMALTASIWLPEWQGVWIMLDKNHPLTAFMFDLTGVVVILGVVLIMLRKYVLGSGRKLEGLPAGDWPAYSLIGSIIIIGFVLEAMRIAMNGTPHGSQYAFLGFVVSRLFTGVKLTGIYGYIWYLHAIFTGAFVAYLPFSRMFHMIMAPVSLAINASAKHDGR